MLRALTLIGLISVVLAFEPPVHIPEGNSYDHGILLRDQKEVVVDIAARQTKKYVDTGWFRRLFTLIRLKLSLSL